jgi:3-hydroxybutyryl-CoA dehydratase
VEGTNVAGGLTVGSEINGPTRVMTAERVEWYGSAMLSAAAGDAIKVGSNIHTDEDYAKAEGLPGVIADGMITTNWISSLLVEHFGLGYVERGELLTKFIKPVPIGMTLTVRGRVRSVEPSAAGGLVYTLDVWCEDSDGVKVTAGEAKAEVAPSKA